MQYGWNVSTAYFRELELVPFKRAGVVRKEGQEPSLCVHGGASVMLYADAAGIGAMLAEGLVNIMTVIVTVFEEIRLKISKRRRSQCFYDHETRQPRPHRSLSKQHAKGINRRLSYDT